ncbi:hypothetical protein BOTBODRAFT_33899 [Botryobasidium botryosum FD-172 SS1]|uniref:Protein kinase domain-containing protein n=1 Tax=Botryobasidium botryosum (strain FD-172 SS1) TaxID=930990 RepID=A0A067MN63_BOTB1|nr:hypothetical protein BOTBODRAFT_33899 [Botryobasidium botryosum FD-172 SS1]
MVTCPSSQSAPVTPSPSSTLSPDACLRLLLGDLSMLSTLLGVGTGVVLQEGVSSLIAQMREAMHTTPESERGLHIGFLLMLYAYTGAYPCDNGLSSFEVAIPEPLKTEGSGAFGTCIRGVFLGTQQVVLKSLYSDDKAKVAERLRREATLWKQLRHPRILRFIGLHTAGDITYMVSPWMENGHATAYVTNHPDMNCLNLLLQIAEGLQYLHNSGIVHGDVRGPNILISTSGDACIADFGLSNALADFNPQLYSTLWHTGGNPRWVAPELMITLEPGTATRRPLRTKESDVFSFGRVIVELTTACAPFAEVGSDYDIPSKVKAGEIPMRPVGEAVAARGLVDDVWNLAQECWSYDPASRPTATEVFQRLQSVARNCVPARSTSDQGLLLT